MQRVAINGLGRIGRLFIRAYLQQEEKNFEIVAANDLACHDSLAYLMKYDTVHGRCPQDVSLEDDTLKIGDTSIKMFSEKDPANLPWKKLDIDLVLDCTGLFRRREQAALHQKAGASKVLISAPSESADLTIVMGVNERQYDPAKHHIISNASCTTNSLAPAMKVLLDNFGVEHALVTTVHAYTISQSIIDKPTNKKVRGRGGASNIIPTSTGADKATVLVLPELKGKIAATCLRVPIPDGAITDISVKLNQDVSAEEINKAFKDAAESTMKGVLDYTEDEIVSSDILGDSHSSIIHALSTRVIQGRVAKIHTWYDNEFGYASRLVDTAMLMTS